MYDTIVVGGGPAGMMAAIWAAKNHKQVVLLEKNEKLGKKLYITGKGRCNITNDSDVENHLKQVTCNNKFLYSAFYSFDSFALIEFLNNLGLETKVERGQRVFPVSDKSSDVISALYQGLKEQKVDIKYNETVKELLYENNEIKGVVTNGATYFAKHVIIATGGKSYDMTGSTGDGYGFAKSIGHKIVNPIQGLVPIETVEKDILELQGLALKNVTASLFYKKNSKKPIYSELGEMLFTHFGVSGPLILSASSHIPRDVGFENIYMEIDLKPGLSIEKLDRRLVRDFDKYINKSLKNGLLDLLPSSMISIVIKRAGLDEHTSIHQISKEQRMALIKAIKQFQLHIQGLRKFNEAIITRGGIDLKDIDPHTMESKKVKNLFFVGEVLDLDALTGGYNLQIAFSTAYLAGLTTSEKE